MVVDFGDLKRDVKGWIDRTLDHTLLLAEGDPIIELLAQSIASPDSLAPG